MQLLEKKSPEKIGLIGHCIINYPNEQDAKEIIARLVRNGADLIELQIPFSEPIADGPIFAKANQVVIDQGFTLAQCYQFMKEMTDLYDIPFVFMSYANIVYKQGFQEFVEKAKQAGAKGAIVPDLPLDLAPEYYDACCANDFAAISVVSPNISTQRLTTLSSYFDGFIYALARAGVTGTKTQFDDSINDYLARIKKFSELPIAVGFGISDIEDLKFLRGKADYAVIGTQTIRSYQEHGLVGVEQFWQQLATINDCD
jgi:tryptophan synthase alpha chain